MLSTTQGRVVQLHRCTINTKIGIEALDWFERSSAAPPGGHETLQAGVTARATRQCQERQDIREQKREDPLPGAPVGQGNIAQSVPSRVTKLHQDI